MIIIDTREKTPFQFSQASKLEKLDTGDYSLEGLTDKFCIERKSSVSEWAMCCGREWKRFSAELERMQLMQYTYLLFEFSIEDLMAFPSNLKIPRWKKRKIRIRPPLMLKRISYIEEMGVEVIFGGSRENCVMIAEDIFKDILKKEGF